MDFSAYQNLFEDILTHEHHEAPYNDAHFLEYTKLNQSRMNRWLKVTSLKDETVSTVQSVGTPLMFIVITEPWCGDAAHNLPFIKQIADQNPLIQLNIQLRDAEGSEIENYLTNGTRSIPKLIVRNEDGRDLFVWGPRPKGCQDLMLQLKEGNKLNADEIKMEIQKWYNADKGDTIQKEISELLNTEVIKKGA